MLDKSIPHIGVLMVKTDTTNYPRFEMPEGFTILGYHAKFETEWANLMFEVDQTDTLKEAQDIFENEFLSQLELLPKQCLFALDENGKIAATASLWHGEHFGQTFQRIHWVATLPEYQGKGLIKVLLTKLLDVYNELGYKDFVYLTSQTWSYKALNIYSQFGFKPYFGEKPINWKVENFEDNNKLAWYMIDKKINEYKQSKQISFSIQKAVAENANDIAFILCETWRVAYKDILTKADLDKQTDISIRQSKLEKRLSAGTESIYFVMHDNQPCGMIAYCSSRDADMSGYAEIVAVYTLEQYWGKGVGRQIMEFALSEIKRLGYKNVMLWVFEANARARRFYEKCGFVCDNTTKDSGFANAQEIRYRLEL